MKGDAHENLVVDDDREIVDCNGAQERKYEIVKSLYDGNKPMKN